MVVIKFKCFKVNSDGTTFEIKTEGPLKEILKPEECYIIVSEEYRKVYLWKGANSGVRSRFIGARMIQEIRAQVGMDFSIVPLDEGEEDPDFLNLIGESFVDDSKKKRDEDDDGDHHLPHPSIFNTQLFKINPNRKTTKIEFDCPLKDVLSSKECYIIVSDEYRKVYLWKGKKSNVRSKFIGAKRSQDIRGQVGMHFGVVPLDEGDEDPDFIKLIGGRFHRFGDEDRFPYPYVFKPPEPPDDLALALGVQLHTSPKKKDPDERINCQFCGMELTKEEQSTHSCKKRPKTL